MNDHLERLKVVGLGNPMLDISATVDTNFLKKHGLNANTAKHIAKAIEFKSFIARL